MTVDSRELAPDLWVVETHGRLDHLLSPQLETTLQQLLDSNHSKIIVDLSQSTYINSGGLRALVSSRRKARRQQGDIVLCGPSPRISEIIEMTGFDQVFHVYKSCREAQSHSFS